MRNLLVCLAFASLLTACATSPEAMDKQDSSALQSLINAGKATELAAISSLPFIVDQEIVNLPEDLGNFWSGLTKAGLRLDNNHPGQSTGLQTASYQSFADTMDMRVFFKKYLDAKTRLLSLKTSTGKTLLILVSNHWGKTTVYGMKGPF